MSASAAVIQSPVGGILPGRRPVLRWRHADVPAARDLAAVDLIAPSRALELPSLFGVEYEYIYNGGTTGVCDLCKQLLRLEIGTLADWEESQHTPLKFIHLTCGIGWRNLPRRTRSETASAWSYSSTTGSTNGPIPGEGRMMSAAYT